MINLKNTMVIGSILVAINSTSSAATVQISASGSGWCHSYGSCNNTDTNIIKNHYAGYTVPIIEYRNWFAFQLPNTYAITDATISIWNNGGWTGFGDPTYSIYEATNFDFNGLTSNTVLGSTSIAEANSSVGHYVTISLNNDGIAALNSKINNIFIFGGDNDTDLITSNAYIFPGDPGNPTAYLTLNVQAAAVPEPSSALLVALGGSALIGIRRKKSKAFNNGV